MEWGGYDHMSEHLDLALPEVLPLLPSQLQEPTHSSFA